MLCAALLSTLLAWGQVEAEPVAAAQPNVSEQPNASEQPNVADEVSRQVRRLADDQIARREAAEKAILELGPAALEHLPPITPRTDAEMKQRLERIRLALEKIDAEAVTQGSTVTLVGPMSLAEALDALEQQTGNKIAAMPPGDHQVQTDFLKMPYWEALDRLLDQAGLTVNVYGGEFNALSLAPRPEGEAPRVGKATYAGVFRIEPVRIRADRNLRNPEIQGLRLTVEISWEPRVTPISLELPLADLTVVGDQDQPLEVDAQQGSVEAAGTAERSTVQVEIPLALPNRGIEKIQSLQGELFALIPGRREKFTFEKLADIKEEQQRRAGVTVSVMELRKNQQLYDVHTRITFDEAANALESHRGWIYDNDAFILDAQGSRIENLAFETNRQLSNEVGLVYRFQLPDGPAGLTFVYETPAAVVKRSWKIELTDILLP